MKKFIEVPVKFLSPSGEVLDKIGGIGFSEQYYIERLSIAVDKIRAYNALDENRTTVRMLELADVFFVQLPYDEFKFLLLHPHLYKLRQAYRRIRNKYVCWNISGGETVPLDTNSKIS